MKALVTGGAGFIGSHIARALCHRGCKVVVLDNLSTGKESNLNWKKPTDELEFVQSDISNHKLLRDLVQGCDWVFHQAAVASVPATVDQPFETNRDNLESSLALLCAARDAHVRRLVFASSAAIYGNNDNPIQVESQAPNPLSPYALQKYGAEKYGQLFHQLYGLETVSLRYFNVFGPRQAFNSPYSGVIAKFCTVMLQGQPPKIFGDGLQSRDFVFIDNVVNANLLAAQRPAELVAGQVFNIAGGSSISLLQLVADINQLTHQKLEPTFHPPRVGDVRSSAADISLARKLLSYSPEVPWLTGLERTLDFYRADHPPSGSNP